jgi:N-glycosylase/DNA lyase
MVKKNKRLFLSKEDQLKKILSIYNNIKPDIKLRLAEFEQIWEHGSDLDLFCELAFCLFTPQSKAKSCSEAVEKLLDKKLILDGTENQLSEELNIVRFKYTKAKNLIEARKLFFIDGEISIKEKLKQFQEPFEIRNWLVGNVKGLGYKEASHFLRNIGMGGNLAILDRHILKNLERLGVIDELPKSLTGKRYIEIEKNMSRFSKQIAIPLDHLDLVLWYKETGEIFK